MSTNLIICILLALSLILCPFAAMGKKPTVYNKSEEQNSASISNGEDVLSVMISSDGRIDEIEMKEYLVGCVAAEMPAVYHSQALKAQTVACYTYALYMQQKNRYENADITDNPNIHQAYIGISERREKWGDDFQIYEDKVSKAVDEVYGMFMTYNGEPILAVYHSLNAGSTYSAKSLWGSRIPYLISVESPGDKLSPDYLSKHEFTEKEFASLAEEENIILSDDAKNFIGEIKRDESGYVNSVVLGNKEISGEEFRNIFSLRSSCFETEYNGKFIITVKGHGHGAGMSQYGADYMARQGFSWQEILRHYYAGIEIENNK